MRALNRTWIIIAVSCAAASTAVAQESPADAAEESPADAAAAAEPATPAQAPAPMPARKLVGNQPVLYTSVGVTESPTWTLGASMAPGISLAVGLNFSYDGNGLPDATGARNPDDKISFRPFLYGTYYFYNKFPVALGFETTVATGLSPNAFDVLTIQPGINLYYAPFPAPVVIGTALNVQINIPEGPAKATIRTLMPGLRVIYVFAAL